jgi:hypothetical protein
MNNEKLYEFALDAIRLLYADESVSKETAKLNFQDSGLSSVTGKNILSRSVL